MRKGSYKIFIHNYLLFKEELLSRKSLKCDTKVLAGRAINHT